MEEKIFNQKDIEITASYLAANRQEVAAELMAKMSEQDREEFIASAKESVLSNDVVKTGEKEIKEIEEGVEVGTKPARMPIHDAAVGMKESTKDSGIELKYYGSKFKEKMKEFWDDTISKGKEAIEKSKGIGKDGANAIASSFAIGFSHSAVAYRESLIRTNEKFIERAESRLEKLSELKESLDAVKVRGVEIKAQLKRDPVAYEKEQLGPLNESKELIDNLIKNEKDRIDKFEKLNKGHRENIENAKECIDQNRETLDQVIDKYSKETKNEKAQEKAMTKEIKNSSRDDR